QRRVLGCCRIARVAFLDLDPVSAMQYPFHGLCREVAQRQIGRGRKSHRCWSRAVWRAPLSRRSPGPKRFRWTYVLPRHPLQRSPCRPDRRLRVPLLRTAATFLSFESLLRQECRKTRRGRITRKDRWHCSGGHIKCERNGIERIPLLASPQGGVAERLIKCRESLRWSRGRGGFPIENNLNRVQPHDWTKFLRARLDEQHRSSQSCQQRCPEECGFDRAFSQEWGPLPDRTCGLSRRIAVSAFGTHRCPCLPRPNPGASLENSSSLDEPQYGILAELIFAQGTQFP